MAGGRYLIKRVARLSALYRPIFVEAVMLAKRFNVGCLQETLRGADVLMTVEIVVVVVVSEES